MKHPRPNRPLPVYLLTIVLFIGLAPAASNAVQDAIIAVVNDEVITMQDLHQYIREAYAGLVTEGYPEETIKQIMLDLEINGLQKLIEDRLILSKAKQIGITITDKRVDDEVDAVKKKYPSEELFKQSLIRHGASLTDLRNKITEQLKKRFVIDHEIRSKIYISPQEVTAFYQNNPDEFRSGDVINLNSLFLPFTENREDAFQKAGEALARIQSGEEFGAVAQAYSKAPPMGKVSRGQLIKSVEEKIFAMEKGEVSGGIEVPTGLYIFKVIDKQAARVAPLDEVKEEITNVLFNQKFRERITKWMDDLKRDAYIEIKQ
jgi:parvulin-like peptidyl-prolyl isomerase